MISVIIQMLQVDDWMIGNELIDFAKGSHELPRSLKDAMKQEERRRITRKKNKNG